MPTNDVTYSTLMPEPILRDLRDVILRVILNLSVIIFFFFFFTDYVMCGLFRPLEEHVGTAILNVGALHFVVLLGCKNLLRNELSD